LRSQSYRHDLFDDAAEDEDPSDRRSRWRALVARPKDLVSLGLAVAATAGIILNALFLQSGPHPAPIFAALSNPASAESTSSITAALPRPRPPQLDHSGNDLFAPIVVSVGKPAPAKTGMAPSPAASPRQDSIADLLDSSSRLVAVQEVLTQFGYGQIKPTGILGPETKAAIEKFERERKLPVTGQMSERLVRELAVVKGGAL
jgi:hypothetical protein